MNTTKNHRPYYSEPGGNFMGVLRYSSHTVTYSEEQEAEDVMKIQLARKSPEMGLNGALEIFWWINKSTTSKEIDYTKKEAISFEATWRLLQIDKAKSFIGLIEYIENFDISIVPNEFRTEEVREMYTGWMIKPERLSWLHRRDSSRQPSLEERFGLTHIPNGYISNFFSNKVFEFAKKKTQDLQNKLTGDPEDLRDIEKSLSISQCF